MPPLLKRERERNETNEERNASDIGQWNFSLLFNLGRARRKARIWAHCIPKITWRGFVNGILIDLDYRVSATSKALWLLPMFVVLSFVGRGSLLPPPWQMSPFHPLFPSSTDPIKCRDRTGTDALGAESMVSRQSQYHDLSWRKR